MNFIDLAKERYSVRNFDTKKIEQEKLDLILKAGQLAPTAVNYQPQKILVIESNEALEKLKNLHNLSFQCTYGFTYMRG